jgi:pimeloyl-ACP methyl ester carboxylesterase
MAGAERKIETPGGVFAVTTSGAGPDALFLHGGPELSDYLGDLAGLLDGTVTSYRYTQRGVPPAPLDGPFTVAQHVADAVALIEALELHRPLLIGHSWGGFLAAAVAAVHPERISGLVSIDGLGITRDGGMQVFHEHFAESVDGEARARRRELDRIEQEERPLTDAEQLESMHLIWPYYFADPANAPPMPELRLSVAAMGEAFADIAAMLGRGEPAAGLGRFPSPALFITGEQSGFPAWVAEESAGVAPAGRALVIPAAGHFTWIEQPDLTRRAIAGFVGLVEAASPAAGN